MGFFKSLFKDVAEDTIGKVINLENDTQETAEDTPAPEVVVPVETVAQADRISAQYDMAGADPSLLEVLTFFPKWTASPVTNIFGEIDDGMTSVSINAVMNEDSLNEYQKALEANGFTGDSQIQRKIVNDVEYVADFSFAGDDPNEMHYVIIR